FDIELDIAASTNTTVTVVNITGQVVKQVAATDAVNGKISVDMSGAAAGVYFVQIQNDGQSAVKKVTITR
ncbi:MAG TPA: T9SS type A sorting domain-containing protein, partial [Bacteroidia bacterium]|nr:T9SS type A sorting domain-containing protein [Bacteroidia bacterium]